MQSVNFVVLGEQSIADKFGKKGTVTDLTLYDRKESGMIRTWVAPSGFPEKIQPLFQAVNLAEYAVFHVASLDRFAGEQMVALDILEKRAGILSHSYDVDRDRLNSMIKGTVLDGYKKVEPDAIRDEMARFEPVPVRGKTRIVIDHCFDVKGVGTVVLGKVLSGAIRQYDVLKLLPSGIDVTVKSIQMHDDPVDEASSPARVGLSLKGAKPGEISRGDMLCEDSVPVGKELELDFEKNPFSRDVPVKDRMCLISMGLQIRAAKFLSADPVRLVLDKPAICESGIAVILRPESDTIRILGSGKIDAKSLK